MSKQYEKLKTLLKELFQLNQPDLDFGLYRIMRARSGEITQFLDKDLLPQVKASFAAYQPADKAAIQKELDKVINAVKEADMDPEQSPKVKELRAKLANEAVDIGTLESEVYDHLYSFFRRYYSEGDFISKRVYKEGVYAIPYEGEEVKLHWANADQYYIKTSEYLRDYAFRLNPANEADPKRVHFRLADVAEGEHGNVKEAEGKNRVFVLASEDFISEENKELVIKFEYRPATLSDWPEDQRVGKTKPPAQKELITVAEKRLLAVSDAALASWIVELGKKHTKADGEAADYSKLVAHLNRYTARNTFDYFIHKDLGKFLNRELDFYIKNEVMHLDDVESETVPRVEQYLSKIKVIRKVAKKIIDFLAQLEDFQKKLWLKKKFVVETNYCITLDRVPEEFYPEIVANTAQIEEWVKLGFIEENIFLPQNTRKKEGELAFGETDPSEFSVFSVVKENKYLVLDTKFFSGDFKAKLIGGIENFDEQMDGLLIHSENFQALNLLQARYKEQVKCVYIDPPYNTGGDDFLYKDSYQHSSWLSLITDRLVSAKKLIQECGSISVSIDLKEFDKTISLLDSVFSEESRKNLITVKRGSATGAKVINPGAINISEFVLSYSKNSKEWTPEKAFRQKNYDDRYGTIIKNFNDPFGIWQFETVLDAFSSFCSLPKSQLKKHFGLKYEESLQNFVVDNAHRIIQFVSLDENSVSQDAVTLKKQSLKNKDTIYHLERDGKNDYYIRNGKAIIFYKDRLIQIGESFVPGEPVSDIWDDVLPNDLHNEGGVNLRKGKKPEKLVHRLIEMGSREGEIAMDFFMGSGTTGAVCMKSKRKWIGIEHSDYFDEITLKRLKLTLFGDKSGITEATMWKGGGFIKYLRLESYEDTLNNLDLRRTKEQAAMLDFRGDGADAFKEDYILRYMMDVESRGSASLLNIDAFTDPTAYRLKVKIPGSDESRAVNVDLVETFNYLLGLQIKNISAPHCMTADFERDSEKRLRVKGRITEKTDGKWWFRTVTGTTLDGRKILVIWRKRPGLEKAEGVEQDNLVLDEWFKKMGYSSRDSEFDTIYVNGTNNLENLKTPDDLWKVRLIEEDFARLMFEDTGV